MDLQDSLEVYGLTDKESRVYVSLLKHGTASLQIIAGPLPYPRTTVYNTLQYLKEKGLVSTIKKGRATQFQAADPARLLDILDKKATLIRSVLPDLESLYRSADSSRVQLYEGRKGIFAILSDVFSQKRQVCYFGSYSLSKKMLDFLPEHFRSLRLDRHIPARIVIDPYKEERFQLASYRRITKMRYNRSLQDFPLMVFIYGQNVAFYTLQGTVMGMIIENKQTARAMQMVFETYWTAGKEAW